MRIETTTRTLYQYSELSDKAKEKAREWYSGTQSEMFDQYGTEFVYEDAATIADLMGLDIRTRRINLKDGTHRYDPCIYWSGFSSQGDGACFEGNWSAAKVQPGKAAEHAPKDEKIARIAAEFERIALANPGATASSKHSGHYYHALCMDIECWDTDTDGEADKALKEAFRDFANWIYRQLEKEYEYQTGDECATEALTHGDWEFTESGEIA
jgi:hypothetical protein